MGFIMDGLDAEEYDRTYSDRDLVRRILDYFTPYSLRMVLVSVLICLNSLMQIALPLLTSRAVDSITGDLSLESVAPLLVGFLSASVLSWLFNFFRQRTTATIVASVVFQLREDAFAAVMARDMSFYDEYPSGSIVSRVTSDTHEFSKTVTLCLDLMSQVLVVVFMTGVLFFINVRLAWITLAITPFVVATALSFRHIARNVTTQVRRVMAEVNTMVQETVAGIAVAKNFRQERSIYDTFTTVNRRSYDLTLRQGIVFASIFPALFMISGLATAVLLYFGGDSVVVGQLTHGEWFLFITSIELFWFATTSISSFWSQFQLGMSAAERVFALVDAEPRVTQVDSVAVERLEGHIRFDNVDFQYSEQERVLHRFNLELKAGETVAVVGHTGAGKSSLGRLVARFYEFQGGRIEVDGRDIRAYDLSSYHRQLGIVSQTPFLFSGTVRDNIKYGMPDATDKEADLAAHVVGEGFWIRALPDGLDTDVGEMGNRLSLGQRQLVALARLIMQSPSMIILDEATASVDPLTESQIQDGLDFVLKDRTAIVIAHRLSTIQAADRIIVMRQGEIIEEGNHEALMARGGHYAELYATYFRHHALDYEPV